MKMRAQIFAGGTATPREASVQSATEDGAKLAVELLRMIEQEHEQE